MLAVAFAAFAVLLLLHLPLLRLPYYWDEAGYYIPAALDFFRHGLLIPCSTQPSGHTPLVSVYLGALWHLFGFSASVTRVAMVAVAAAADAATYALAERVAGNEAGIWSAALLGLSPVFFAQSTLVFPDLTATLFTVLTVLWLLEERWVAVAVAATLAVMSKETAVVMIPVLGVHSLIRRRARGVKLWLALALPVCALGAWAAYYHHATGFWNGNPQYLEYNLYSVLTPLRVCRNLLARLAEIFFQGFNFLLTAGAIAAIWWTRRTGASLGLAGQNSPGVNVACSVGASQPSPDPRVPALASPRAFGGDRKAMTMSFPHPSPAKGDATDRETLRCGAALHKDFFTLALSLIGAYILFLSFVGGAVLPRYMLPSMPFFIIIAVTSIGKLPLRPARLLCVVAACCLIGAWFINPPYPFPYEDNLSYADFVRLHQQAARYLENLPGNPVVLTAWPATDELRRPALGYITRPLRVAAVNDFTAAGFRKVPRFDVLYLYSRAWEPFGFDSKMAHQWRVFVERFYNFHPQVSAQDLQRRYRLKLLKSFARRGQWVEIFISGQRYPRPRLPEPGS